MIPLLDDGVLPEGIHDCTMQEIAEVFGRFQRSDRRIKLTARLEEYLREAKASALIKAVIVNGSYISAKDEPNDIDLIAVLFAKWEPSEELKPFQYNVLSKRAIKRQKLPFDLLVAAEGSSEYDEHVDLFSKVNPNERTRYTQRMRKGLLRINL